MRFLTGVQLKTIPRKLLWVLPKKFVARELLELACVVTVTRLIKAK